ncbi:MAG: ABC transporter ATP-binding protein [Planctomycetota bacterium]|nr:ABC transporter ATP-binding protein [Planctomycetota bacterium]
MLLEAAGISCTYDGPDVLNDLSLRIEPGEFVAVTGPNGSGKSTLLRTLSRVLKPKLGQALLDGKNLYELSPAESARSIAVVPQQAATDFDFTCEEIVTMGRSPHLKPFRGESKEDLDIVKNSMKRTGTWELKNRTIADLSGGERQRVILARAFAQSPQILILDEATAHLDLRYQVEILKMIQELKKESNTSVLGSFHDLNLALPYADRIVLLENGRIAATGTPEEVVEETLLRKVFGEVVRVCPHPITGKPMVVVES